MNAGGKDGMWYQNPNGVSQFLAALLLLPNNRAGDEARIPSIL